MGFLAVGSGEFMALEPALGGRGGVGRGVGLEVVFDLASDHMAGSGNCECGGLDFPRRVWSMRNHAAMSDSVWWCCHPIQFRT